MKLEPDSETGSGSSVYVIVSIILLTKKFTLKTVPPFLPMLEISEQKYAAELKSTHFTTCYGAGAHCSKGFWPEPGEKKPGSATLVMSAQLARNKEFASEKKLASKL